uniref:Dishevelled binding antagonist of beta catenin 2 n=1 Tax=Moschus moschiferus TaxID=68415 RepID=A0A8C6D2M2_MOSMO
PTSPAGPSSVRAFEAGPAVAYIERLLRLRAHGGARQPPRGEASPVPPQLAGRKADGEGGLEKPACTPGRAVASGAARGDSLAWPAPTPSVGPPRPSSHAEGERGPCHGHARGEARPDTPQLACGRVAAPRCPAQLPALTGWTSGGRWLSGQEDGRCTHPHLVASGASPSGPPKTKPATVRRGPSDKTAGPGRPQLQWGTLGVPRPPPESGGAPRRPTLAAEAPGRSCSESSLYPVSFFVPLLVARQEGHRASAQALFPWEAAPLGVSGGAARKRQRRWQSSVEISARARPDPGLGPHRPAARRGGGPRPVCARPRPPPARQDALARSASDGSEHSPKCTSLLLSTAAESSGDEASDHTASRFGDAESSSSDSGTGGRPGQRARASSRPPLPPVPRLCRVKASKALKRKIRRFQPATLKVMTMV